MTRRIDPLMDCSHLKHSERTRTLKTVTHSVKHATKRKILEEEFLNSICLTRKIRIVYSVKAEIQNTYFIPTCVFNNKFKNVHLNSSLQISYNINCTDLLRWYNLFSQNTSFSIFLKNLLKIGVGKSRIKQFDKYTLSLILSQV